MDTRIEQAALGYLARGWSVVPLRPRDKRPILRWQDFQHRHPDPDEVRGWYRHWPEANVGVVTGAISGLVVVDVDPRHGGEDSLAELVHTYGPLPQTAEAVTGGGGRHLYFAHAGRPVHNRAGVAPGIDLRGDGGYIVAPPSRHPAGGWYAWVPGSAPEAVALAPLPRWLPAREAGRGGRLGHPVSYWRDLAREGVAEGARNSTLASFAGHLLWHGVDPDVALELLLCWNRVRCRPPLADEEVIGVLESITRLHRNGGDAR
ncbi:bifunctional DNA primase/polymerase [Ectothiorhodospiraceae bacterium 2226]|nr:bifunctional DNA primase/polymerase [Ectothiorhodospiraceae bacterium 2226]